MKRKSLSTLSREPYPGSLDVWTWNMETEGERRRLFWISILNSDFDAWEFLQLPFKNGVAQATAPAPGSKKNLDGKKVRGTGWSRWQWRQQQQQQIWTEWQSLLIQKNSLVVVLWWTFFFLLAHATIKTFLSFQLFKNWARLGFKFNLKHLFRGSRV